MSEGTVTKWLKQAGETIALDEPLLEISTDKVDTEVPSPRGRPSSRCVQEGETVEVGTVLAVIGSAAAAPIAESVPSPRRSHRRGRGAGVRPGRAAHGGRRPGARALAAEPETADGNGRTFVSPVVARIAAEHGVDPSKVSGTGQGGRVTKKDILTFIESGAAEAQQAPPPAAEAPAPAAASAGRRSGRSHRSTHRSGSASAGCAEAPARRPPPRRCPRSRSSRLPESTRSR